MNEEIAIAWIDLGLSINSIFENKEKLILNGLNGSAHFGSLNALMGPSGSGKTTLLKCINGKFFSGLGEDSKIYLNSKEKIRSCFIGNHEKEHLIMGLTAKQNLIYASKLKNSAKNMKINHQNNVDNLLSELMTNDITDNKVEDCSGGEQRRLLIALELTSHIKPNLICIDEPTSGIDSSAAEVVIQYLKLLSRKHNISIITSIHQPNSDVLMMFDKLYVLAKGGVCIYSGLPQDLNSHLNECDIECAEFEVPIEAMLKIASKGNNDPEVKKLAKKTTEQKRNLLNRCEKETNLYPNGIPFKSKNFKLIDMWYLLLRTMTYTYISQWKVLLTQLVLYISCPLIITKTFDQHIGRPDGCFNFDLTSNKSCLKQLEDDSLIDQNLKFHAFTSVLVMLIQLCVTTLTFSADIQIFMNQHQNKWYSCGSFYLAKNIVELFPTVIYTTCYAFMNYYSSGQLFEYQRIVWYIYTIILGMLCTQGLGFLTGIICIKYEQIAIGVSIGVYLMLILLSNIFIPLKEMPQILQLMSNISFTKFVYYSGLIIFFGFDRCPSDQLSIVLYNHDMNEQLFYSYAKYLLIYCLSLRVLAFIMLYIQFNNFFNKIKPKNIIKKCLESIRYYEHKSQTYNDSENVVQIRQLGSENNNYINMKSTDFFDQKLSIAWIDLSLRVEKELFRDEKIILRQLNGCINFGSLDALLGPSGAGKTSLLRSLSGRYKTNMTEETHIYLSRFKRIRTCFISQDVSEHLINGLTAKQTLIYASKLKNSDREVDHENSIKYLINDFLISDIVNTNVEKCSSGEKKRLVMAMELTSHIKPNLLFIDEPTSGLDSNASEVVIKCLKSLSRNHNISIITSIHQPNSDVLMMFDKLYVLAKGGVCVYSGLPQELNSHLNECGIKCTEFQVPIEVLLKHACNGYEDKQVIKLAEKTSQEKQTILSRCVNETQLSPEGIRFISKRFKLIDFWYLLLRIMTYTYRYNWKLIVAKLIVYITFGYSMSLFFGSDIGKPSGCVSYEHDLNKTCHKTTDQLEEESLISQNIRYNFLLNMQLTFLQIIITTMTFTLEMKIFINEHRNGWYSTGIYYWAKSIEELIPTLITMVCYSYIADIYNDKNIFFGYLFFLTIGVLCVQSYGHIIGIVFNANLKVAVLVSVTFYVMLFILSNFFVPIKELHYSIQWLSHLSTVKLLFESIMILFYGFGRCSSIQFSSIMFVLGLKDQQFYMNIKILIIKLIVLRIIALIALYIKVNSFSNRRRDEELHQSIIKSLPMNAYIPGLNSYYKFKLSKDS